MAWRATFEPRIIAVDYTKKHGFYTNEPPPVALQVNHEARDIALKHYSPCFGNIFDERVTYFNYKLDTLLYFHEDFHDYTQSLITSLGPEEVKGLERIAIHEEISEGSVDDTLTFEVWDVLRAAVKRFPALKSVEFVDYIHPDAEDLEVDLAGKRNHPPRCQIIHGQYPRHFGHHYKKHFIEKCGCDDCGNHDYCEDTLRFGRCDTCYEEPRDIEGPVPSLKHLEKTWWVWEY